MENCDKKTVSFSSLNARTLLPIDKSENPKNPTTEVIATKTSGVHSKKILAEKNGSYETHLQNSQTNSDRFGENEENSSSIDGSASRPYDPLTNYLSPRPKFIRYKPDRRREVLLRLENEKKGGRDGVSSSGGTNSIDSLECSKGLDDMVVSSCVSVSGSSVEGNEKIVNGEEGEDSCDEFEEDYEEDRGCWNLRGVFKFMLLLVVLVASTSYISSMNSPTSASPTFQAILNIKDGSYMIRDRAEGLVKSFSFGSHTIDVEEKTSQAEINSELIGGVHSGEMEVPDMCEGEFIEDEQSKTMEIVDYEEERKAVDELAHVMELENEENLGARDYQEEKKAVDELVRVMGLENEENFGVQDYEEEKKAVDELIRVVELESGESLDFRDAAEEDNGIVMERSEKEIGNYDDGIEDDGSIGIKQPEQETIAANKDELIFKATATVVSVLISVIGSLILTALHFKWRRIGRDDNSPLVTEPCIKSSLIPPNEEGEHRQWREEKQFDNSPPVFETCIEPFVPKRSTFVPANEEGEYKQWCEDLSNTKTLIEPHKEESKAMSQSHAPSVELLGEFVVGEVSSSLRSHGMKSRMVTSEVNSHSVSAENRFISKNSPPPVEVGSQPTLSAVSAKNSSSLSYQNKTANKKKGKKGDESANKDIATPTRRSARIRNLTVTSP